MAIGRHLACAFFLSTFVTACGGGEPARVPDAPKTDADASAPSARTSTSDAGSGGAATDASASSTHAEGDAGATSTPKGTFHSFARAATSGKVDKIGSGDGAFKPDGIKDLVFDVEVEGNVSALLVVAVDAGGTPTGEFGADTLVGSQALPAELAANLNLGKNTAGMAVYEGDKLLNAKDGSVALAEGRHKVTLHVSSKSAPKDAHYMAIAILADRSVVKSAVLGAK